MSTRRINDDTAPPGGASKLSLAALTSFGLALGGVMLALCMILAGVGQWVPILFLAWLLALVCGHTAISQIKQSAGWLGGRWLAIVGVSVVYASLGIGAGCVFLFGRMFPPSRGRQGGSVYQGPAFLFGRTYVFTAAMRELSRAKQVGIAIQLYTYDHGGRTPPNLEALVPDYISEGARRDLLATHLAPNRPGPAYDLLIPNVEKDKVDPHIVMLRGRYASKKGERVYIYADTSGELVPDP